MYICCYIYIFILRKQLAVKQGCLLRTDVGTHSGMSGKYNNNGCDSNCMYIILAYRVNITDGVHKRTDIMLVY